MAKSFVTTLDNPYNFFTQFDEWYAFDTEKGYNTCAYLARLANVSSEMSEKDYEEAVERVIEDVLRLNITGNYVRVVEGETTKKKEENIEKETK